MESKVGPVLERALDGEKSMRIPIIGSRQAWHLAWFAVASVVLSACSGDEEPKAGAAAEKDEHVWKEKTQTIDKARDVGRQLEEAAARQKKASQ